MHDGGDATAPAGSPVDTAYLKWDHKETPDDYTDDALTYVANGDTTDISGYDLYIKKADGEVTLALENAFASGTLVSASALQTAMANFGDGDEFVLRAPEVAVVDPFRVEEVSRDDDVVTYGIYVNGDAVSKLYDGLDGNGVEETVGVASISTKLGYTPGDFVPLSDGSGNHLDDFKFTTALSTLEIFALMGPPSSMTPEEATAFADSYANNQYWSGGRTDGVVGSPQVLEGIWNLSGTANTNIAAYNNADTDFSDPWMMFSGTLAAGVDAATFTLFETEFDNMAVGDTPVII
jgi:hypothetical protein